jgi:hypothetical protein
LEIRDSLIFSCSFMLALLRTPPGPVRLQAHMLPEMNTNG